MGLAPTELSFISRIRCERTPAVSKSRRAFLRQVAALKEGTASWQTHPTAQQHRLLALDTPLGKDVLLLQGLTGHEGISRLFSYELDLLAFEHSSISFQDIVGQKVTISIQLPDGTPRYINGYVSRFTQGGTDDRMFTHYPLEVVPWLWFLTRQADCRIFQNMTPPNIISQVFNLFGFKDFRTQSQVGVSRTRVLRAVSRDFL